MQKNDKKSKLFNASFNLFIQKGIINTTIQDIVDKAGVAKGTFYLYFKDKYDLQEQLIIKKSHQLFKEALIKLEENDINDFASRIIFVINYVIDELIKKPALIKFISKDLSLGLYSKKLTNFLDNKEIGLREIFLKEVKDKKIEIKNPEVTLFMIIELVSSACFTSITENIPLPISEFKPYLYDTIKLMLN